MNTLILNGAARPGGDTAFLLDRFKAALGGDFYQVDAISAGIHPCTDCRWCWEHDGCVFHDGMDGFLDYLQRADVVALASPIQFSELSGPLLSVASRLQCLWTAEQFRGRRLLSDRKRRGVVLLAGGGYGAPKRAIATAKTLLSELSADPCGVVLSGHTDQLPAKDDEAALAELTRIVEEIRGESK